MLTIRKEQMKALEQVALKDFEDDMVEHIKEFFPNHYKTIGESQIRKVIQYAIERGEVYGFTTHRNVCLYLNNMLILGSNFDVDPQYPWAAEILNEKSDIITEIRIDKLSDKTLEVFSDIAGTKHIHLNRAFLKLQKDTEQVVSKSINGNLKDELHNRLKKIFPSKYEVVGEQNINKLVECGFDDSKYYHLKNESNVLIYIIFMFMLGRGFNKDPQFIWAEETLKDPSLIDDSEKIDVLCQKAKAHLNEFLAKY